MRLCARACARACVCVCARAHTHVWLFCTFAFMIGCPFKRHVLGVMASQPVAQMGTFGLCASCACVQACCCCSIVHIVINAFCQHPGCSVLLIVVQYYLVHAGEPAFAEADLENIDICGMPHAPDAASCTGEAQSCRDGMEMAGTCRPNGNDDVVLNLYACQRDGSYGDDHGDDDADDHDNDERHENGASGVAYPCRCCSGEVGRGGHESASTGDVGITITEVVDEDACQSPSAQGPEDTSLRHHGHALIS